MKVSELEGAELDVALDMALGSKFYTEKRGDYTLCVRQIPDARPPWKSKKYDDPERYSEVGAIEANRIGFFGQGIPDYHKDWCETGPLIEEWHITIKPQWFDGEKVWTASAHYGDGPTADGRTPSESACRAIVASVYGDHVPEDSDGV